MQFDKIIKLPWHKMVKNLLIDAPTNCTWMEISDYIENKYNQEQILQVNFCLWKLLDNLDLESKEADDIRDECDPWWYAMTDTTIFDLKIKQYLKEKNNVVD